MKIRMVQKHSSGIALLVALATMIVVLIVGSLALYVVVRGMSVTRGQVRYETTYEAAVAALEISKAKAESLNIFLDAPPRIVDTVRIGRYRASVTAERTSAQVITMSGTAIKFARAMVGPGATPASGSYRTYYISATILARSGERVGLEAVQRFTASVD
ncbi:MAG: hypothetical protein JSU64_06645 [candidate division WOR-3 bacterium]|nr:MAG: hypothetical protein JSU64_06645 [candidate division WOR-3 bacterium]